MAAGDPFEDSIGRWRAFWLAPHNPHRADGVLSEGSLNSHEAHLRRLRAFCTGEPAATPATTLAGVVGDVPRVRARARM